MSTTQLEMFGPRARATDPASSHDAAKRVRVGQRQMEEAIEEAVRHQPGTAFQIASFVNGRYPDRWDEGSIRTTVSRLGKCARLVKHPEKGLSPRGIKCDKWITAGV